MTFPCLLTNTLNPVTFEVIKDFVGNSSAIVDITLVCTSGTVSPPGTSSTGTAQVQEGSPATFTIADFNIGATCTLSETPEPSGYFVDYGPDCVSVLLEPGTNESCEVDNLTQGFINVGKDFSDNNQMNVNIVVDCDSGTDIMVDGNANEGPTPPADPANWEIRGFTDGASCAVPGEPGACGLPVQHRRLRRDRAQYR